MGRWRLIWFRASWPSFPFEALWRYQSMLHLGNGQLEWTCRWWCPQFDRRCRSLLFFLPSYFPNLNPIEEAFSFVKSELRNKEQGSEEDLLSAFDQISPEHACAWVKHAGYWLLIVCVRVCVCVRVYMCVYRIGCSSGYLPLVYQAYSNLWRFQMFWRPCEQCRLC